MSGRFVIQGGHRVEGTFRPTGNKNAALPMLAACLLTAEPVILRNVPMIQDVQVMLDLLRRLGVSVDMLEDGVRLQADDLKTTTLDADLCRRIRASILLAGPLLARFGSATLFPPGGDVIGRRRIDTHVYGFEALGGEVAFTDRFILSADRLRGANMLLDEASVTATENIVMAAALAEGTSTIFHAACEPHVQDVCNLLIAMGAQVEGHGTNRIVVHGCTELHGAEFEVGMDYVELGSFVAAAAVTGGRLSVPDTTETKVHRVLQRGFHKVGLVWSFEKDSLIVPGDQTLRVQQDLGFGIPKIEDGIWPAFPSDLMSVAIVVATQSEGSLLFFEKMFESRMYFVDRLIEMGAHIVQCDPHRVVVQGATPLQATHMSSPDIRAGMAMMIAALCAKGESIIESAYMVDRGYERIDERLRELGAHIERVE